MVTRQTRRLGMLVAALIAAASLALSGMSWAAATTTPNPEATQQYRPQVHFSPQTNWMNDPNGLVYYNGLYHLFYQYNPSGNEWGNMSWGHATSPDLVHWTEQPLAIPYDDQEDIFSGSVVADTSNTSGFGTPSDPPLVSIFTSAYTAGPNNGLQAQSLAYSLDDGQTWTKYAGNPVLSENSANFRDPKVFWYSGPAGSYWVMVAVEATQHEVEIYKSTDLKSWTYLSEFGPANATGGVWEMPDLFPLDLDGDPNNVKWVLTVGINPGSVAGGSGDQYFVGSFDGTTFTSEDTVDDSALPSGTTFEGFNGSDYDGWTATGSSFGSGPATGGVDGQQAVTGFDGAGFVDSFHGGDASTGTLTSPSFTIGSDYINFLVGGGNHPHVDGAQTANDPPAGSELLFDGFEYPDGQSVTDNGWTLTGDFTSALNPSTGGGTGYIGEKELNTFLGGPNGDSNEGTMTSPTFTIDKRYLSMLLSGGYRDPSSGQTLQVELLVNGQVVETAAGTDDGDLNWQSWDLSQYQGQQAQLRVDDQANGSWGSLAIDNVVLSDTPAQPHDDETAVDLLVNGQVVRTATGSNAENLDWASWNVSALKGDTATIEIVDNNTSGWGHINADQFMFSNIAQTSGLARYNWVDWGSDFYAGNSFNNVSSGQRIILGWMNNWNYAGNVPTTPWRGQMSLPREVELKTVDGEPQLTQEPVSQLSSIEEPNLAYTATPGPIDPGTTVLPDAADASVAKIDATISAGSATSFGIVVRRSADGSESTPITYDTTTGELSVDRTASGNVSFDPSFPTVDSAPVALQNGQLHLEIYLDKSSVEVFAQDGERAITDLEYPSDSSTEIALTATGGTATLDSLTMTPLEDAMWGVAQTISFAPIPNHLVADPAFALGATSDSGLPVSYSTSGPCSVTSGVVSLTGVGTCAITATQQGNESFDPAAPVTQSFTVSKATQTITFPAIAAHAVGDPDFPVAATSDSGLPVSYITAGPCSVNAGFVYLTGAGTCQITASQAGNSSFAAAAPVTRTFAIGKASQTITFAAIANRALGTPSFSLSATASSGLPVSFKATGACSVSGRTLRLLAVGKCTVTASQSGGASYLSAASQVRTFSVTPRLWSSVARYRAGDKVTYNGLVYLADWSSRNVVPGRSPYGPWEQIATAADGRALWTPSRIFVEGAIVEYSGKVYRAAWWSRNDRPGSVTGPWEEIATAADGTAIWTPSRIFWAGNVVLYKGHKYVAHRYNRDQAPGGSHSPWTLRKQ